MTIKFFTEALLTWFDQYGRHDLPWQNNITPYRVWVSEIMLQQTQVATVIPYYQNFTNRFSNIELLAESEQDEVLRYWSGLGYYARGRNLHRCAQIITSEYQGEFPSNIDKLCQLPGIGRSTAGAILSFGFNIRAPILDGNVKRVLTRFYAIESWSGEVQTTKQLWELTEQHTPEQRYSEYNQAIMDLGATVCTRRNPHCSRCPVANHCKAFSQAKVHDFPVAKKKKTQLPTKVTKMLIIKNKNNEIFLEKRPPVGIWGGLWSFPECRSDEEINLWATQHLKGKITTQDELPPLKHKFTHFELVIYPVLINFECYKQLEVMDSYTKIWYKLSEALPGGIPAPISKLLKSEVIAMVRSVFCAKLSKNAEGLDTLPYPGDLGKRIYENISKEAWREWIEHQTRLINEYRLSLLETKARKFLEQEMEKFLFGNGSDLPPGYVPPKE